MYLVRLVANLSNVIKVYLAVLKDSRIFKCGLLCSMTLSKEVQSQKLC